MYLQNKTYARELDHKDLKFRGRIRIQLKNEDGTPKYEKYPTRKSTDEFALIVVGTSD